MNLDEHQCNLVFRGQDLFGQHQESALKDEPALITAVFFPRMFRNDAKFRRIRAIELELGCFDFAQTEYALMLGSWKRGFLIHKLMHVQALRIPSLSDFILWLSLFPV